MSNLSPQQFGTLYHASSPARRDSIAEHGLQTRYDPNQKLPAVYLSERPPPEDYHGGDVWEVRAHGLKVGPDGDTGEDEDVVGRSFAHEGDIGPDRLRLHRKG